MINEFIYFSLKKTPLFQQYSQQHCFLCIWYFWLQLKGRCWNSIFIAGKQLSKHKSHWEQGDHSILSISAFTHRLLGHNCTHLWKSWGSDWSAVKGQGWVFTAPKKHIIFYMVFLYAAQNPPAKVFSKKLKKFLASYWRAILLLKIKN